MKLLMVAAACLAVVSCASLSLEDLEFHTWKLKFGKVYSSPEEEARRKDIWLSTRRSVLAHNILADQGVKTYRMGMNHLSDMDEHEFMTLYSSLLSEDFINSRAQWAVMSPRPLDDTALPKSVNWTAKGCVTPVKNQGPSCRSCWAFSAVGALESHTCIKHGHLTPLSEQQLVDCSWSYGNKGCYGGHYIKAFQYCIDNKGIVTAEFYPYVAMNSKCRFTNNPIPSNKIGARCSGYRRVLGNELSLQRAVAMIGPVSISISVHPSFSRYHSGVYYEPNCPYYASHAMLVVGYGTTEKGEDYWLVKNSHGHLWGEAGYIRMARNKNNNCGIASDAVFPVVN